MQGSEKKQDLFKNCSHLKVANLQVHPFTFLFFKINLNMIERCMKYQSIKIFSSKIIKILKIF